MRTNTTPAARPGGSPSTGRPPRIWIAPLPPSPPASNKNHDKLIEFPLNSGAERDHQLSPYSFLPVRRICAVAPSLSSCARPQGIFLNIGVSFHPPALAESGELERDPSPGHISNFRRKPPGQNIARFIIKVIQITTIANLCVPVSLH